MLREKMQQRANANLIRVRKTRTSAQRLQVEVEGQSVINFSSNDYLGLANHPALKKAAIQAIERNGIGSGASQMICGYHILQKEFEQAIAAFLGFEDALVFSSGYLANIGVLMAFGQRHAEMFTDKDNHASLIDGAHACHSKVIRYQHNQASHLAERLQVSQAKNRCIVTDGVFSMDGSIASLADISELARIHQAYLVVDDAHGIGVLGAHGRGSLEHCHVQSNEVTCLVGTLGKSFGGSGAFVCGSSDVIDFLKQYARTGIYSTAIPPLLMASAMAALKIIEKDSARRNRLGEIIRYFSKNAKHYSLPILNSLTPIQPMIMGDNQKTMQIQALLLQQGFWIAGIRPPTVANESARLRLTLTADHEPKQIDAVLAALDCALTEWGVAR